MKAWKAVSDAVYARCHTHMMDGSVADSEHGVRFHNYQMNTVAPNRMHSFGTFLTSCHPETDQLGYVPNIILRIAIITQPKNSIFTPELGALQK